VQDELLLVSYKCLHGEVRISYFFAFPFWYVFIFDKYLRRRKKMTHRINNNIVETKIIRAEMARSATLTSKLTTFMILNLNGEWSETLLKFMKIFQGTEK
jgi:hypothetical protein